MRQKSIGRRSVLVGAGSLLVAPAIVRAQGQGNGVALVIGNSKYRWEASLPNVRRDAPDVAKRFQALGLRTELIQDVGHDAMRAAIDKFSSVARGANLAAFYFAGHGASWDKDTYLVPEDADLANPSTVQSLLSVRGVSAAVKEAGHRLVVFDNCRNNPAGGWRQGAAISSAKLQASELSASMLNEPNTLVLYSTASGRIALDGPPGENSPFAAALLRQLDAPSVDLQALPGKLRRDLLIATGCRQLLWDQNTYSAPFVLKGSGRSATSRATAGGDPSRLVELPNAYAFAREKDLLLPAGLIAYRAPTGSPHARKIGAYEFTYSAGVGHGSFSLQPMLFIILAVAGNTAEVVNASKSWRLSTGTRWGSFPAPVSGDRINWWNAEKTVKFELKWRDANSGIYSAEPTGGGGVFGRGEVKPFTRLDG